MFGQELGIARELGDGRLSLSGRVSTSMCEDKILPKQEGPLVGVEN